MNAAGLHAGFLIGTEHILIAAQRSCLPDPLIQVEHAGGLDREIRVAGTDPGPVPPPLEHVLRQPAAHRARRDRRRDAPGRGPAGRAAPLRQRRPARRGQLARQRLHLRDHRCGERARPARCACGRPADQPAFGERFAPSAHHIHIQPPANRRIRLPVSGHKVFHRPEISFAGSGPNSAREPDSGRHPGFSRPSIAARR
jgi:hypothetical protein